MVWFLYIIQLCKTINLLICNGRLNEDKDGNLYTYINVNGEVKLANVFHIPMILNTL